MLMCAILNWGKDLLIRPVDSVEWVKDMKRRLDLDDVDFIIFDSGYFTPLDFDNGTRQLFEDEVIELFGNPGARRKRHPAWDREDEEK